MGDYVKRKSVLANNKENHTSISAMSECSDVVVILTWQRLRRLVRRVRGSGAVTSSSIAEQEKEIGEIKSVDVELGNWES